MTDFDSKVEEVGKKAGNFLTKEVGGIPVWGFAAVVVVLAIVVAVVG